MIPYGRQDIRQSDIDAVAEVLRSDFLTTGPAIPRFEELVAAKVGVRHAVAVTSATSALHIACLALDVGPNDVIWTVPNTFVASANCGRYCGAGMDFVDIEPGTGNISVAQLADKLAAAKRSGQVPKAVVPVHFGGQPPDQEAIWELAREYGVRVIEDASHAIGASRNGEPVGSCRWSDITIFSFHPVKIITTGEGGMAVTNDDAIADRLALLRSHGITRDPKRFVNVSSDAPGWYYEQQTLGFNYRMTDVQAALGASQMQRLDEYVGRRNELAERYDKALAGLPLQLPVVKAGNRSSFHLYVVRVTGANQAAARRKLFDELRGRGIGVNVHYMPVHLQPYYRELGFHPGQFPEAEAHGDSALTLPLYAGIENAQQDEVLAALQAVL